MLRALAIVGAVAIATAAGGCFHENEPELSTARNFDEYELYYLGDSFQGQQLSSATRGKYSFNFTYGDCEPRSDTGCALPLEVQNYSICDRYPLTYGSGTGRRYGLTAGPGYHQLRGALARGSLAPGTRAGSDADIYTGQTTITIFAYSNSLYGRSSQPFDRSRASRFSRRTCRLRPSRATCFSSSVELVSWVSGWEGMHER
jgi:hypothetical protein